MNKYVIAQFHLGDNVPQGLSIRLVPIYAVAGFFTMPVERCPNHAAPSDQTNHNIDESLRRHLIRVDNEAAWYVTVDFLNFEFFLMKNIVTGTPKIQIQKGFRLLCLSLLLKLVPDILAFL